MDGLGLGQQSTYAGPAFLQRVTAQEAERVVVTAFQKANDRLIHEISLRAFLQWFFNRQRA